MYSAMFVDYYGDIIISGMRFDNEADAEQYGKETFGDKYCGTKKH